MHIQAVYFLLNIVAEDDYNFEMFVDCNGERFSADFLELSDSKKSVISYSLDHDFDLVNTHTSIYDGIKKKYFWAYVANQWLEKGRSPFSSSSKGFEKPFLLLQKLIGFVGQIDSSDWDAHSNIVKNIKFSNNERYENYVLEDCEYRIVSIKVSKS